MRYVWTTSLETGYEQIDEQHRQLFALANRLAETVEADEDDLEDAVYALTDYVIEHFSDEEALMTASEYPQTITHKLLHQKLTEQTMHLTTQLFNGSGTNPTELSDLIAYWLTDHIGEHDVRVAEWLRR